MNKLIQTIMRLEELMLQDAPTQTYLLQVGEQSKEQALRDAIDAGVVDINSKVEDFKWWQIIFVETDKCALY